MSPWWLRPPSDESDEPAPKARASEADADALRPIESALDPYYPAPPEPPPSIADLVRLRPEAVPEPIAEDLDADDEPTPGNGDSASEDSEPARKRRRRGGRNRRRGRGGASDPDRATPATASAPGVTPTWEEEDDDDEEDDYESVAKQLLMSMPVGVSSRQASEPEERKIALFCDLENIALGVRDSAEVKKFDIHLVLERLLEKGKIIVKRAYADWERYSEFKIAFHEEAIELIDIPQRRYTGKNSADIKMVVDAMDLSYAKEHLDTFVVMSGDSDFSPLVSKLKENNKYVIGIGVKNSSSNLLVANCDEFVYYEDVWRDAQQGSPDISGLTKKKGEVFTLLVDSILALQRENKDVLFGSMVKQTMQRKKPSFNEGYYGYSTFTELLQDAERHSLIRLKKDQRSGTWVVTGFAKRK